MKELTSSVNETNHFSLDINSEDEASFISLEHPLDRDTAILPTYALECFISTLHDWLRSRVTGAIVWGFSRVGKSKAIRYLVANGEELLGVSVPMAVMNAWDPTPSSETENRFFQEMLRSLGYASPTSGNAGQKKDRIVDFITAKVRATKEYRFILFIDEGQDVSALQLRFLMNIFNALKDRRINLITVLVGNTELPDKRSELQKDKKNFLLSRFMTGEHQFVGISAEKYLSRYLRAFDEQSEFPLGSGISYTAHFVPKAFNSGWRLAKQGSLIWKMFNQVVSQEHLPKFKEFPMIAMTITIVEVLEQLALLDSSELVLERALVEEAIYRIGLVHLVDFSIMQS